MKKKSVCILRSNPVDPDSRVEKEAWSLCKAGYDVTVFAWDRDSDHPMRREDITVAGLKIPIVRVGYRAGYGQGRKSLIPFMRFQWAMMRWILHNRSKLDIIHACDFDTALFSFLVKGKVRFIYDIFDFLYGEPASVFQKFIKKLQIMLINHADATIICTEERKEQIAGATPKCLGIVHNTPFDGQRSDDSGLVFQGNLDKIKIVYVGIYANERLLIPICHVVSRHPEVELHIGGFGELEHDINELAKANENIFCYGRIPYNQTLDLESRCDIMLAVYDPSDENCRYAAPNKFYESLMLGKPVMMAKGTGMSYVIEQNDTGVLIDFSEAGFEQGIVELIHRREEWPVMGAKMKRLYTINYNWQEMNRRLISLYDNL